MPLLLIVSEIYGRKVSKWWKIRNFFELFGPPCRNALADLDGSTRMCAGLCPTYWTTYGIAEKNRNGSCPMHEWDQSNFFEFLTAPPHAPPRANGPHRGRGHVGRHCPYINKTWCGSAHALLGYRSKTAKMQKFPVYSHSNKNFISPFFRPPGAANPKKGEKTHPEPEYARTQTLAWIGPQVIEKSLTAQKKQTKKHIVK